MILPKQTQSVDRIGVRVDTIRRTEQTGRMQAGEQSGVTPQGCCVRGPLGVCLLEAPIC
jgi:hypothetical protein